MPPRREIRRVGVRRRRPAARVVGAAEANVPPVGVNINQPDVASSVPGNNSSGSHHVSALVDPVEPKPDVQLNQPQVVVGAPPPIEQNVDLPGKMFDRFLKRDPPKNFGSRISNSSTRIYQGFGVHI
ncbi:hypothetical protein LIER_30073 [Lithospermum erythrorhizon]|uniref:Uncharacterized protein n=1 Tax=Lithospermum erythrorhizon TaxID=34254 RepID=A0AAV3RQC8_LITER